MSRLVFVHTTPGVSASPALQIQLTSRHCLRKRDRKRERGKKNQSILYLSDLPALEFLCLAQPDMTGIPDNEWGAGLERPTYAPR